MLKDFKAFLLKQNVMALAVAFIFGAAVSKVVAALVNDLIMPLVGMALPGGDWRQTTFALGQTKFLIGDFMGSVVDFVIIAFVIFMIIKALIKPATDEPAPETKTCPGCLETIAKAATRCKFCTQSV